MDVLDISLILSILSCSLVGGFIFTYAIVVMPGLSNLNDKDFLRAFQVTDAVIQNNQPLFMFTWIGSILSVLATILVSLVSIGFAEGWLIVLVAFVYLLGVLVFVVILLLDKWINALLRCSGVRVSASFGSTNKTT